MPSADPAADDPALRLLMVEDSPLDHELMLATLQREGLAVHTLRVQTAAQLASALASSTWDAVISDHQLPGFSSIEALEMVRAALPYCPFIIVSGVMGEDAAVVAMRRGADDYLLKGRLARLVPSLFNALAAAEARRERAATREALERSEGQLRELLAHLETVVDDERIEIAREIHDDIGSALTALRLDMNWIGRHGDAASAGRASQAMQTLTLVMDSALRLQQRLRPAVLDEGLVAALRWLADDAGRRSDLTVSFHSNAERIDVDAPIALAAYRTLQESLTNIFKHAGASRVDVGLVAGPEQFSLEIADNGRGIRGPDRDKPTSFGLRGMSERAQRLGGWVEISNPAASHPAGGSAAAGAAAAGTVVLLWLPRRLDEPVNDPAAAS
jgi:signal transduction histidine kinase